MLTLSHIRKTFKSKKKETCVALNDINFSLDNNGLVFVIGKSGSGKTTLLSLIGGLDKFDSGEIIVNGISLSKLKGSKFDYYRNETIGFIFQDFQLFDELTVEENIKLALDFKNDKDKNKIKKVLDSVGLSNYEKRYPNELSGGEKQRVAIARVLIKNPTIILADEPTGNLDAETSSNILKILKDISKDHLVLIVSHNIVDAHKFADYILELQEGELIGTYKRNDVNEASIEIKDGILRLPLHKQILDSEKENIISNKNYKIKDIIQDDKDFVAVSLKNPAKVEENNINKTHISFINAFKRGVKFLKKALTPMFVFSFITASLFALINSCYAIKNINPTNTINYNLDNYTNDYYYFADENKLDTSGNCRFAKDDTVFEKLRNANYQGEIFKSYRSYFTNVNRHAYYRSTKPGNILQVDEEYLLNRFNKIEYVAKAEKEESYGFYCCDFFIDYLNAMHPSNAKDYESYLGFKFRPGKLVYLNGVIKTDYKEKYQPYLEYIFDPQFYLSSSGATLKQIDSKLYDSYIDDISYYLYNLFTFNENFINDYVAHPFNLLARKDCVIINPENGDSYSDLFNISQTMSFNAIGAAIYGKLTGHYFSNLDEGTYEEVEPITLKLKIKNDNNTNYNMKEYNITFDHVSTAYGFSLNVNKDENIQFFKDNLFNLNGFILDSTANIKDLSNKGCFDDNYYLQNNIFIGIDISSRLTSVFNKVFSVIILGLLLCCLISSAFYGIYVVKKNMRNIGICKSLGARTIDILFILALNLGIAILTTIVFYCGLAGIFMAIIESILHRALENSSSYFFPGVYKLLFNNPIMYILNIILIAVISIISFIALFIKINSLKPIELIKSKK